MFSKKQVNDAMRLYHECGSVTRTIHILGYPSREMLYQWIRKEGKPKPDRKAAKITNTKEHLRNPSADVKLDAIRRCFEYGESIKSVSEEIGYSRASIYIWRKKYLREGAGSLVNNRNIKIDKLPDKFAEITSEEVELLRRQMSDLQMEMTCPPKVAPVSKLVINWYTDFERMGKLWQGKTIRWSRSS